MKTPTYLLCAALALALLPLRAAHSQTQPAPPPTLKQIPPPGIAPPDDVRADLTARAAKLSTEITELRRDAKNQAHLPDVQIFEKALLWALRHDEFLEAGDFASAGKLLDEGMARCASLRAGQTPWTTQTGPVARGYVSQLDGSVQPFGVVVPDGWQNGPQTPRRRLDIWLHGRDEKATELRFVRQRMTNRGEFTPAGAFVLHPYGRFCNAFRFAGEVDVFEAMDAVRRMYPIDDDRIVMRGFSMGGAGAWHLAVHHADRWAAAAPGAGFTETARYTGAFAAGKTPPPAYEQLMWPLYDSTANAARLWNLPVVAYNGAKDKQKAAADNMAAAMLENEQVLTHIVAPDTEHRYTKDAKAQIDAKVDEAVANGRNKSPASVKLATHTLRWNKLYWVALDGLERHWTRADVLADYEADKGRIVLTTKNVRGLTLTHPKPIVAVIADGKTIFINQKTRAPIVLEKNGASWARATALPTTAALRKRPGLQGPIDDAFVAPFVFVTPTGKPMHEAIGAMATQSLEKAKTDWRRFFRGDAPVVNDADMPRADLADKNIVLWGDPQSNKLLAQMVARLPIVWTKDALIVAGKRYEAKDALPVLIFPNPMNARRYIVINSGFTFHNYTGASNAQHAPKLPDWAVLNLDGTVRDAGFFDENWRFAPMPPLTVPPVPVTTR